MSSARITSPLGALRSGAGLVTIATPRSCVPILAAMMPEYMSEPLDETAAGTIDFAAADRVLDFKADVIAMGPGLGHDPSTVAFIQAVVERAGVPLVLDADALNAFTSDPDRLIGRDGVDVIITPHPGEMARLLGAPVEEVQSDRLAHARDFASSHRVHVVLKGAWSAIGDPDGRVFVNPTGNPGMASGGTGDVLTGILGAFLARGMAPGAALQSAVYLHGLAGDIAAERVGEEALIAGDVIAALPEAFKRLGGDHD